MSSSRSDCSAFPALIPRACPRRIKQFNKGQSNPTYFIEDTAGDRWVLLEYCFYPNTRDVFSARFNNILVTINH